jgi:hypothetical protein
VKVVPLPSRQQFLYLNDSGIKINRPEQLVKSTTQGIVKSKKWEMDRKSSYPTSNTRLSSKLLSRAYQRHFQRLLQRAHFLLRKVINIYLLEGAFLQPEVSYIEMPKYFSNPVRTKALIESIFSIGGNDKEVFVLCVQPRKPVERIDNLFSHFLDFGAKFWSTELGSIVHIPATQPLYHSQSCLWVKGIMILKPVSLIHDYQFGHLLNTNR